MKCSISDSQLDIGLGSDEVKKKIENWAAKGIVSQEKAQIQEEENLVQNEAHGSQLEPKWRKYLSHVLMIKGAKLFREGNSSWF